MTLQDVWDRQSVWSQTADRLKKKVRNWRNVGLAFSLVGAVLATAAVMAGLDASTGKVLAAAGAFAVAVAGLTRPFGGRDAVQNWTRARSVSEGIKTEVFLYLAKVDDYGGADRDQHLTKELGDLERSAEGLERYQRRIAAKPRKVPAIDDAESYTVERLNPQIVWYRDKADGLEPRASLFSWLQFGLGIVGAALAAVAGATEAEKVAVWVPVVTTVGASLAAHAAAERYDFLLVEYHRTASELERLKREPHDAEFVKRCEDVISTQNQGWMAKFAETPPE